LDGDLDVGSEFDDLGVDPAVNDPLGLGEPGLELHPDGNFHPADDFLDGRDPGRPEGGLDESAAGDVKGALDAMAKGLVGGNKEQMRLILLQMTRTPTRPIPARPRTTSMGPAATWSPTSSNASIST
jgi:hypothetical protein